MDGTMENYFMLAAAIVIQAVQDYRILLKRHLKRPDDWQIKSELDSCRRFFCSGWFSTLSGADGEEVMNMIEKYPDLVIQKQIHNIGAGRRGSRGK